MGSDLAESTVAENCGGGTRQVRCDLNENEAARPQP
jgi:hypothetical protein